MPFLCIQLPLKGFSVAIFFLFFSFVSVAQTETNILWRKEKSISMAAHSSGWSIGYRSGINNTAFLKTSYGIELGEIYHEKEYKQLGRYDESKSYRYGKKNHLFVVRPSFGKQKLLNHKPYWGGVEVRYLYHAGVSIGITKPVYLTILNVQKDSAQFYYYLTTEKYDEAKHNTDNIYGGAAFLKGFDRLHVYPGLHGRLALNFEFGKNETFVKALEVGMLAEGFPKAIPLMAFHTQDYFFYSLYFSLHLGRRYQ